MSLCVSRRKLKNELVSRRERGELVCVEERERDELVCVEESEE